MGQEPRNFLRDPQGQTIISKLDEDSLRAIATATQGKYFSLGPTGEGLAKVFGILQSIGQQKKHDQFTTELPIDRYQIFLIFGLIFLCLEMLASKISKNFMNSPNLPIIITLILYFTGCLKQDNIERAENSLKNGKPEDAANFF